MKNIIVKAQTTHNLNRQEIAELLQDSSVDDEIFSAADKVRKKYVGDEVHLRALIEFSNICKCRCKYCGLRFENDKIKRYKLSQNEIFSFAKKASGCGYKTVVLQSGQSDAYSQNEIVEIIKKIKSLDVAVTLSIGEKTFEEYAAYKKAGADRYLLRIETTDENLYKKLHPKASLKNRIQCLKNLKKLGYELGTGCLTGLPKQTFSSLADDILFFKKINADMIGIGPFIPHPDTPLKDKQPATFNLALKVMAITRLLMPYINIPATTAMETLIRQGRIKALKSGANVVMPNFTAQQYRKKYEIYPGKKYTGGIFGNGSLRINSKITSIGRTVSKDCGISMNFIKKSKSFNMSKKINKEI